jgi:hypothetical protein
MNGNGRGGDWPPFRFQPGDVLCFRGTDFVSRLIQWGTLLTTGPWWPPRLPPSHVGMILDRNGDGRPQDMVLAESTTMSHRPCLERFELHDGVQLQRPLERIGDYGGACEVWRLVPMESLSGGESRLLTRIVMDYYIRDGKVGYDLLRASISGTRWLRLLDHPDPLKAFCSQLCYALLARVGRLPKDDPARYNPARLLRAMRRVGIARRVVSHWVGDQPYVVSE